LPIQAAATSRRRRRAWLCATALAAASTALPVLAAPNSVAVPACGLGDLAGVNMTACTGFFQGNLLHGDSGDPVSATIAAQLSALGLVDAFGATYLEKIGSNAGSFSVDFNTVLSGDTVIGLHLGGGSGKFAGNLAGGATAFYRFDAGNDRDWLGLVSVMSASSGVALFQTMVVNPHHDVDISAVPEPQTTALMLAGLAGVGVAARRRVAHAAARPAVGA
jgi:PEP-CTERM motif